MATSAETRKFEAETKQLLDIMIHSLYTDKEIALRELISNASDALDKIRFSALTSPDLLPEGEELEIRLEPDADKRTLTIHDNGIGMSRQEVIDNIGSIARSGTQEMLKQVAKGDTSSSTPELIGRFGVGFYSAFMVADSVTLETRKAGEEASTLWTSSADGEYTVSDGSRRKQGTSVTLHLKPVDADGGIEDYTDEWVLARIIRRYSNFIAYPIRHKVRREQRETDEKGIVKPDGETTVTFEDKTLNSMQPIWTRPESEVKDEEYSEFYKHIASGLERSDAAHAGQGGRDFGVRVRPVRALGETLRRGPVGLRVRIAAVRQAGDDHGALRSGAAPIPAIRARGGGLVRPSAQHLPADAPGEPAPRANPEVPEQEDPRQAG